MTPKSIFSLAIRLLGLLFLYHGLVALPALLTIFPAGSFWNFVTNLVAIFWPFAVAFWLIQGAPLVMRAAYPNAGD
jgi:hypothetical protein